MPDKLSDRIEATNAATAKHTPGPWRVNAAHAHDEGWIYVEADSDGVCSIAVDDDKAERLVDARLIASAPALLAACKAALEWHNRPFEGEVSRRNVIDALSRAVWMAEGGAK